MFKYLYLIFRLFKCPHKWKTIEVELVFEDYKEREDGFYLYKIAYCSCTKCGKLKVFKLKH